MVKNFNLIGISNLISFRQQMKKLECSPVSKLLRFKIMWSSFFEKKNNLGVRILTNISTLLKTASYFFYAWPTQIPDQIKFLRDRDKLVDLIIIDSITALFRPEFEKENFSERQRVMADICTQLKFLARKYDFAVLIVNQVSENIDENTEMAWSDKFMPQKVYIHIYVFVD